MCFELYVSCVEKSEPCTVQEFGTTLPELLILCAVNASDYSGSEAQASIGFSYGNNLTNPSPDTVTLFQTAAQVAKACIVPDNAGLITSTNWRYNPSAGYYTTQNGTNYLTRARKSPNQISS